MHWAGGGAGNCGTGGDGRGGCDRRLSSLAGLGSVGKDQNALPDSAKAWVEARRRYHLSHAQVQMGRELGLNPRKLGKIANHRQQPCKRRCLSSSSTCISRGSAGSVPRAVTPAEKWGRPGTKRRPAMNAASTDTDGQR